MSSERLYSLSNEQDISANITFALAVIRVGGIGFDLDGCQIDTHSIAIQLANERLSNKDGFSPVTIHDIKDYYAYFDLFEDLGFDNPALEAMLAFHDDRVLLESEPLNGFLMLDTLLLDNDIRAHRITSRPATVGPLQVADNTRRWFEKHAPYVLDNNLLHMQEESDQISGNFKVETIKQLGLQYYFEDSVEHARDIVEETDAVVVIVPRPWNAWYNNDEERIVRPEQYATHPEAMQAFFALTDYIVENTRNVAQS